VKTGHFLVNGGMMHLKVAIETDNEQTREDRLNKAVEVLLEAITEKNQADNPGAWYYLGRVYTERHDTYGADSAFAKVVAMMPECDAEVARYVDQLVPEVRAAALEAWQEGAIDSAVSMLRLASSLSPNSPEAPFYLARVYAEQQQFDSAQKYVDVGIERAAGNPEHDQRQRQAVLDLVRAQEAIGFASPAVERLLTSRARRDSVDQQLDTDSELLQNLIAEWSGKNLRPETQAAVQRDSTALADRVAAATQVQTQVHAEVLRDSTEAADAFAGAFAAYRRYLDVYPADTEVMLRLYRRHSMLGNRAAMRDITEQLRQQEDLDLGDVVQAANSAFRDGNATEAIALLAVADERNPYMQSTLSVLARAYYDLGDEQNLTTIVQRLLEIDPLNPQTVRLMAAAWDLAGEPDSVTKYVELATSGIGLGVTVTQFLPTATTATVNGTIQNLSTTASEPAVLEFEFIDAAGTTLATTTVEVPTLEPRMRHAFTARTDVANAAAWRYHRQ
jgi:tetratricopeptide (TPR) repeat protein